MFNITLLSGIAMYSTDAICIIYCVDESAILTAILLPSVFLPSVL